MDYSMHTQTILSSLLVAVGWTDCVIVVQLQVYMLVKVVVLACLWLVW